MNTVLLCAIITASGADCGTSCVCLHNRLVRLGSRKYAEREQQTLDLIHAVQWKDFPEIGRFYREEAGFEQRIRIEKVMKHFLLRDFRLIDERSSIWRQAAHHDPCFNVFRVHPQSPEAKAGMQDQDRIIALGDTSVTYSTDWDAYWNYLRKNMWKQAEVTVMRGDRKIKLKIHVVGRDHLKKDDRFRTDIWDRLIRKREIFKFSDEWVRHFKTVPPITIPERWVFILEEIGEDGENFMGDGVLDD